MNYYSIPSLVALVVNSFVGIFVLRKDFKLDISRIFLFLVLSLLIWNFGEFMLRNSSNAEDALFWSRFLWIGSILIPAFFLHFSYIFPPHRLKKRYISLIYIPALFFLLILNTPYLIKGVSLQKFGYMAEFTSFGLLLLIYVLFYGSYGVFNLYNASYKIPISRKVNKLMKIVVLILTFFIVLSIFTNIFFEPFGSLFKMPILPFPFGSLTTMFACVLLGYTIIKSKLFLVKSVEEERVEKEQVYHLERGTIYGVTSTKKAFNIFLDLVTHNYKGFLVSRIYPKNLRKRYNIGKIPVLWLSNFEIEETIAPKDLEKLSFLLEKFLKEAKNSVVLLEGIEYLVIQNDFLTALRFVQHLNDLVSLEDGILLLVLNPQAFDERELGLLKKEIKFLEEVR